MATVPCRTRPEKFAFIGRFKEQFGITFLCDRLGVTRGGYHSVKTRKPSQRKLEDEQLLKRINAIYVKSKGRYGSPKVFQALCQQGVAIGRKRVERLMREANLVARVARIYRRKPLPETL